MALQFKFVELSVVTDEALEETVNEWVGQGWQLEGIRFVTTEHSKRPAMAFVSFTREAAPHAADREAPRRPPPLVKPEPSTGPAGRDAGAIPHDAAPTFEQEDADSPAVIVAAGGDDVD